jgi:hypothetical protein
MYQSPSLEADGDSAYLEISHPLRNPKVYCSSQDPTTGHSTWATLIQYMSSLYIYLWPIIY